MTNLQMTTDHVGVQKAIAALATFPDIERAKIFMAEQGYNLSEAAMYTVKRTRKDEIEQARKEAAPQIEAKMNADMLDESAYTTTVIDLAIKRTEEMLQRNAIADPSRVARDLGQLRTQAIDKRLAMEGRPNTIVEKRSPDEILARLEAMGVAKQIDVTIEEDMDDSAGGS